MKIKGVLLFLLVTINIFASSLDLTKEQKEYLKYHPVLSVQNLKSFAPFNFNENNQAKGYSIDYMNLIAKQLNVDIKFVSGKSWHEYLSMLKNKELDIIPHIAITDERKKFISFTDFYHIEYTIGVAVKKGSKINSMDQLKNKVIAVANKTFLHSHLKKHFPNQTLLLVSSTQKGLEAVSSEKADVVIGSLPSLNYFIQKNWLSDIKSINIQGLNLPIKTQLPMGVAKENKILRSILEKANDSIPRNEIMDLKQKWMNIVQKDIENLYLTKEEVKYLENKKEITMCIDPNWMPFEKNDNGKHIGISADYMRIIQGLIKTPITMVPTKTWIESLNLGKQRKCDIFSLVMPTKERRTYLNFTKPYLTVPLIIATTIDKTFINDITTLDKEKIAIVNGYAYGEILKEKYPHMKFVTVNDIEDGLEQVRDKKVFGFIGTLSTVGYHIQKDYIGVLKIVGKFDDTWNLGIGVRNDELILNDILNKAITKVTEQQHQTILNKWVSVNYQKGIDYTIVWEISFVFVIILLLLLYRNRSVEILNRKLKQANKEIQEQQEMVDKYVLILTTDLQGKITDVNEAYCNATGYTKGELIGNTHAIMRHPDMTNEYFDKLWENIESNKPWKGEIKNYNKDKSVIYCNVYIDSIIKNNKKIGYRSISEDITDKKRIEELSITDKLTGLYNRLKLDEILLMKVEEYRRYQIDFSIILLDIDDFKKVNDTYGHDVGDNVLISLSNILKDSVRITDIVGRWGGEEFVLICEATDIENAYTVAEHLRQKVQNNTFERVGHKTISLGVSQFNKHDTITTVFKRADEALYKAKNSGKNKTIMYR